MRAGLRTFHELLFVDLRTESEVLTVMQALDAEARERGSFLLVGAGLVPGLSAVLALLAESRMGSMDC